MHSVEYDLAYLEACAADLEDYLLSTVLYWPVNARTPDGSPPFPRLTLGGIALARRRLTAFTGDPSFPPGLESIDQIINRTRSRWQSNWARKAAQEYTARLRRWEDFLKEYRTDPGLHAREYPRNVYRRAILELLKDDLEDQSGTEQQALAELDKFLRSALVGGDFCWEEPLKKAFPNDDFWFLYGELRD